jgi:cephalosporin hydroxylase
MNGDRDFVRALSEFLALHTEQSAGYFSHLIESFLQGPRGRPNLETVAKERIASRLKTEMEAYDNVPSFLQNYLLTHLAHGEWPSQAAFVATRYLKRHSGDRFITWQQRQGQVADLNGEPIRGTELGFRQMLYSQGAGPVFSWRGAPCFKSNYDLAIYAMLIDELQPRTIIELGSGAGGSSLLFADLCSSMGLTTQILSIDKAVAEVSDPRITFVQSDCVEWLETTAKSKLEFPRPCLLIEDFHGDLAGFFANIDLVLENGDYLVIEDSFPKQQRISEVIQSRPYLVDSKYTDFFGVNCTSAVNSIFVKNNGSSVANPKERPERQILRDQDRAWRQRNKRET